MFCVLGSIKANLPVYHDLQIKDGDLGQNGEERIACEKRKTSLERGNGRKNTNTLLTAEKTQPNTIFSNSSKR